jgi:hypothetical protein
MGGTCEKLWGRNAQGIFKGKPGFWKGNPSMEATWKSRRGFEGMSKKNVQGKWEVRTCLGLIWRRKATILGLLWTPSRTFGFQKMLAISRIVVELQASQEGLCSMM